MNYPAAELRGIEKPNAGLFELMSLFFAREIKQNEVARNIFEGQLLAKMDVELQGHRLTIDLIEASLLDVAKEVSEVLISWQPVELCQEIRKKNFISPGKTSSVHILRLPAIVQSQSPSFQTTRAWVCCPLTLKR
jgi:hypothetical protein